MPVKSLGGRAKLRGHFCRILVRRCLLSSSRAVFLALAEVNHSTLTIFALPLYKRRGTRPTDPITSLSGNKCLTIRPYWVWEINPFHSQDHAHLLQEQQGRCHCDYYCSTSNIPTACPGEFIVYFQGLFYLYSFIFQLVLSDHFVVSYFTFLLVVCVCVVGVSLIIYVLPLHPKM